MRGPSSFRHTAAITLGLFVTCIASLDAQPFDRYERFRYDTVFRIGAHLVPGYPSFARDTLKLDFTYHYQATWDRLGVGVLASRIASPVGVLEKLDSALYVQGGVQYDTSLKTIFIPDVMKVMDGHLVATDNYAFHNDALQMFTFHEQNGDLTPITVGNDASMFKTISLPDSISGLLVGRPRWVSQGGFRLSDAYRYSTNTAYPFFDIGNGDSASGRDSSFMVRFGFHIQVPPAIGLDSNTVIARVDLWRRVYVTDTCNCAAYEPFDSVNLTYGQYLDAKFLAEPLQDFKDVGFWIDTRDSTETGWFNTPDSTYYHARPGVWGGAQDSSSQCDSRCPPIVDTLNTTGHPNATDTLGGVEGSDIFYDFYTTGNAKIRFLRGRVATHEHEALLNHRFDSLIDNEVRLLFTDSSTAVIRNRMFKIAVEDEPTTTTFDAHAYLTDSLQAMMVRYDADPRIGLFQNPVRNYDGFRRLQFDLDSSLPKRAHMLVRQDLAKIGTALPVYYVRPDKMVRSGLDDTKWMGYYPPSSSVAFNTTPDYLMYTTAQQNAYGKFLDYTTTDVQGTGPIIPTLARMVDVSRFKYASLMPDSIPVYNVVNVFGGFNHNDSNGLLPGWVNTVRPKTPEEIYCQSFITLLTGCQGLEFDELRWDGVNLGIADHVRGIGLVNWSSGCQSWATRDSVGWDSCDCGEWDTAWSYNSNHILPGGATDPKWLTPQMWLGLRSRYLAVKRIAEEMRRLAPAYQRLFYKHEQISAHDPNQSYTEIPMLAAFRMQRANYLIHSSVVADTIFDAKSETYAEITHFYPGVRDSLGVSNGSRVLGILNRRTWPIDHAQYGAKTTALKSASATLGFGFRDMRRPYITLRNSSTVIADSFIVEKIGYEDSLRWEVRAGEEFALDWLEPGWGGLYRITPIVKGVSHEGTAYNNGVHSENPSTKTQAHDRLVVVERDSIIYLRTVDSTGKWSREFRVSDAGDTNDGITEYPYWQPVAVNHCPSIATVRDSNTALIVWERYVPALNIVTIEGRLLYALPTADSSQLPSSTRFRMTPQRPRLIAGTDTMAYAPSVVGLKGGYAVAFPTADTGGGISVILIRSKTSGSLSAIDSLSTHRIKWDNAVSPTLIDSSCFPTLAYAGRDTIMTTWTQVMPQGEAPILGLEAMCFHLAHQQGKLAKTDNSQIIHSMLGARFRTGMAPILWVSPPENASAGILDCGLRHPSIAADRARIGIAFQGVQKGRIILRHRENVNTQRQQRWGQQTYIWGSSVSHYFDWPSLTHFPAVDSLSLEPPSACGNDTGPEGGLVWTRPDAPGQTSEQYFFRYGWEEPKRISNGMYPTMTLVAKTDSQFYEATSILYRGDSTTIDSSARPYSTLGTYYPARLENGPAVATPDFYSPMPDRQVIAKGTVRKYEDPASGCPLTGSFDFGIIIIPPVVRLPNPPPAIPSVAPSFFGPTAFTASIATASDVSTVTRTGLFVRTSLPITVSRVALRDSATIAWLDSIPYDTVNSEPHDILLLTELVRDSDSVVLWRDDTMSVRTMSTDSLIESIEIPSQTADSGTVMYVRLRAIPSAGLPYSVDASYTWDMDTPSSMLPKRTRLDEAQPQDTTEVMGLALTITPNPTRGTSILSIRTRFAANFRVGLFDMIGRPLQRLPNVEAAKAGTYDTEINLDAIPNGVYLLRVESDNETASITIGKIR